MTVEQIPCSVSRVVKSQHIFPNDLNNHHTLFGGKIVADMDMIASLSATKHSRKPCVTASIDHVDFIEPVTEEDFISYESFVVLTGKSSMIIFVKVIAEHLITGVKRIAATSFLTFVALEGGKPAIVPKVVAQTEEEKSLQAIALERKNNKRTQIEQSKSVAKILSKTLRSSN
ncbi:acyl-CoA thioesterase [Priestia aryabhattai]|uniref:acyl-CoA thioesterase n=1 Tax=Bacillaceae TaxID=186817 RepID=UPI000B9FC3B4|nr:MULTISPECIES: acyl-CoA thioesterase [Bacillaceae]MDT2046082.1 acyl-CoA thioesterase [Priestia flexa]OZT11939.1 acyl-CoA thioesterase [Priestia aryabhattai]TDB50213.1 acyl-CoA thioesterase [Bacillus sp. CBEL-1]USY53885.1 acyl-CoA thioesterase [Bacillus sp. 1780r2a1]